MGSQHERFCQLSQMSQRDTSTRGLRFWLQSSPPLQKKRETFPLKTAFMSFCRYCTQITYKCTQLFSTADAKREKCSEQHFFCKLSMEDQCLCHVVITHKPVYHRRHGWGYGQRIQGKPYLSLRSTNVSYRQWKSTCKETSPLKQNFPFGNYSLAHSAFCIDGLKK